jgi:hypothetical protein
LFCGGLFRGSGFLMICWIGGRILFHDGC